MGRWAQSRRRGTGISAAPTLPAPETPELTLIGAEVRQLAQGGDDTGGTVRLESSGDGVSGWLSEGEWPWQANFNWGDGFEESGLYVHASEVGNGVSYSGPSAWCEAMGPL